MSNLNLKNNIPTPINNTNSKNKIYHINGCDIFFGGRQNGLSCGRHALNNIYGGEYFTACLNKASFNYAVKYSNEELRDLKLNKKNKINLTKFAKMFPGNEKEEARLEEYYDIKVIRGILKKFGNYEMELPDLSKLNYNNNQKNVLGYLIANGGHYYVIKKCGLNWIKLDSLKRTPLKITIKEIQDLVSQYKNIINFKKYQKGIFLVKKSTSNLNQNIENAAITARKGRNNLLERITNEQMKNNIKFGVNYLNQEQVNILNNEINSIITNNTLNNTTKTKLLLTKIIEIINPNMEMWINPEYTIKKLKGIILLITKSNFILNLDTIEQKINNIDNSSNIGIIIGPKKSNVSIATLLGLSIPKRRIKIVTKNNNQ